MATKKNLKHAKSLSDYGNYKRDYFRKVVQNGNSLGINMTRELDGHEVVRVIILKETKTKLHMVIEKI